MSMFRILEMKGVKFGRFENRNFSEFNHNFVVVYGPNETGKSTLTEFITWMVGGPVGEPGALSAVALRFGEPDQQLSGQLVAELNGQPADIAGKFKVKKTGVPNDERTAVIGGATISGAQLAASLGHLQADDYAFIYRFIGPALHDTESAANFSSILSQFAIGSSMTDVSPAEIVKQISSRATKIKGEISELDKKLKAVNSQLTASQTTPQRLQDINNRLDAIEKDIAELNQHEDMVSRHLEFLQLAINAFDQRDELLAAKNNLEVVPAPSAVWATAISQAGDIQRDLAALKKTRDDLSSLLSTAEQEAAKVGMSFTDLSQRRFSLEDKSRVQAAGTALKNAEVSVSTAEGKANDAAQEVREAMSSLEEGAQALDRTVAKVVAMPSIDAVWQSMNNAAILWSSKEATARDKAIAAQNAQQQISTAEEQVRIHSQHGGIPASASRSNKSRQTLALAIAVVGMIVGYFADVVIIPTAIVVGVLLLMSLKGQSAVIDSGKSTDLSDAEAALRAAQQAANTAKGAAEEARTEANGARESFVGYLTPFALDVPAPEYAQALCQSLLTAISAANRVRIANAASEQSQEELRTARSARDAAHKVFQDECVAVGIDYSGSLDDLTSWLDQYQNAVQKVLEASRVQQKFSEDCAGTLAMFGDVAPAESDLLSARLLEDLQTQVGIADARRKAEERVATAEYAAKQMVGGKQEVQDLLDSVDTKAELESKVDAANSDKQDTKKRREDLVAARTELLTEKGTLENTEFINELNLKKSQYEEEKEELDSSREAALLASATLKSVIDEFQLKNQGPLVKRANELLNQVVSGYGDLMYSTDEQGKPVIERVSTTHRLRTGKLSTGSRALAYLALRLAFVEADQQKRGIALPVLCDDPLVHIDDDRAPEVMKILAQAAAERQVILFTCHEDTRDLAFAAGAHVVSLLEA